MFIFVILVCIGIYFIIASDTKTLTWWTEEERKKINKYTITMVLGGLFMSMGFLFCK